MNTTLRYKKHEKQREVPSKPFMSTSSTSSEDNEPASNQNNKKEGKGKQTLKGPSCSKSIQSGKKQKSSTNCKWTQRTTPEFQIERKNIKELSAETSTKKEEKTSNSEVKEPEETDHSKKTKSSHKEKKKDKEKTEDLKDKEQASEQNKKKERKYKESPSNSIWLHKLHIAC